MFSRSVLFLLLLGVSPAPWAQIGGQTSASGTFVLDDVEDLNLNAASVERDWISDVTFPSGEVLRVLELSTEPTLVLGVDQTPIGAFRAELSAGTNFIDGGFGVPMPGLKGASTDVSPGNITSFTTLSFYISYTQTLPDQKFQVLLESNVTPATPQLLYEYTPVAGTTFQRVAIELREPDLIIDGDGVTVEQMLANTRFLYFYFFAGPVAPASVFRAHLDDFRLEDNSTAVITESWYFLR